ncbi:Cellobiose dehydrogenase [Pseudocercospora fuligena]|uniref:Cellobiose dehydrogenase n=1 Tax=Pseudocercospora fuligena TaxID=685502 RepID=A0A8H6RAU5_9PEZI|nr:Cellobiose dehydrogenase [Pseudocercospora fuligena]
MAVGKKVLLLAAAICANALPAAFTDAAQQAWDVIVVGAGPAGIVTAARMSEAGKKTLLLEQGGPSYYITGGRDRPHWLDNTQLSRVDVPGLYKSIFAEQGNLTCQGKVDAFTGCTIGGSSAINAELFFQPPASDFDRYFPNTWKSKDVANAIAKVHKIQPSTDTPSKDGKRYLQTGYTAVQKWLVGGAGYSQVDFKQQPDQKTKAFGRPYFAYEGGQRSGPVKTYLQAALSRSNFHLMSGVQVKKVIRNGAKATGVEATINGAKTTFNTANNGRVILSGGALFSPQLLMLSGIGPADSLTNLSHNGLLNMPSSSWMNNTAVGNGLYDNPNTFIMLSGPSVEAYYWNYTNPIPADRDLYLKSRSGPYSFAGETSAFWDYIKYPNGDIVGLQGTMDVVGFGKYTGKHDITLNVYGTSGMKSTGRVALNNKGIPGPAKAFLLTNPQDVDAIATFIKGIFTHLEGSPLTSLNIPQNATKAEIAKYITTPSDYTLGYVNHWSSSCRLGSCVDLNAKVKGMENLFVVDASIIPPLTVNPVFGTIIAAERASELILALK